MKVRSVFLCILFVFLCGCGDEVVLTGEVLEIVSPSDAVITAPPESVWDGIRRSQREDGFEEAQRAFYTKYVDADGIAILSDARVADQWLLEARQVVLTMTLRYPALRDRLRVDHGFYIILFKHATGYNDISHVPELFGTLGDYRTYREQSRHVPGRYCISGINGEHFGRMRTVVHEFAHALHSEIDRLKHGFSDRVAQAYQQAKASDAYRNLWDPYIVTENLREYWAEGVVIWYYGIGEDREFESYESFAAVDPLLYELLSEWFYKGSFSRDPIPGVPQYDIMWEQVNSEHR